MAGQMSENEIYELAKKRVEAKKGFYGNLAAWAIVNSVLVIVWALTDRGGYLWFLWPLCIWGFFVLVNFVQVFVLQGRGDKASIEREAEKIRREQ
ncbi:MAG: 2TM domain-containing protein [Dehalococcoidales bacterium]|nr:MAG: 2TM domain-containing protein [Dehalococcoidales bacterium]